MAEKRKNSSDRGVRSRCALGCYLGLVEVEGGDVAESMKRIYNCLYLFDRRRENLVPLIPRRDNC